MEKESGDIYLKIALVPYAGGILIHILRLIFDFPLENLPFIIDLLILVPAAYAGVGFLLDYKNIPFRNLADRLVYLVIMIHLVGAAVLHGYVLLVQNHELFINIPDWYSYSSIILFSFLFLYCLDLGRRMKMEVDQNRPK